MALRSVLSSKICVWVKHTNHESRVAELVNAAGYPFGALEDALDGIVGEEGAARVTGDYDMVAHIADGPC